MKSIVTLVKAEVRYFLVAATLSTTLAFMGAAILIINNTKKDAKALVGRYSLEITEGAVLSQDIISAERAITRFANVLETTQPLDTHILIKLNDKLIIQAGSIGGIRFPKSIIVDQIQLQNGQSLQITATIGHWRQVLQLFWQLLVFESLLITTILLFSKTLARTLRKVSLLIQSEAHWIREVANQLPLKGRTPTHQRSVDIEDVAILKDAHIKLIEEINRLETHLIEANILKGKMDLATQVAHDIRSPLAALALVINGATGIDEKTRTEVRTASRRISDIANNLLEKYRLNGSRVPSSTLQSPTLSSETKSTELISSLIESAVSQKRAQFTAHPTPPDITTQIDAFGAFAEIQPTELTRVLSNLLNNAIEANPSNAKILVRLSAVETKLNTKRLRLTIQDNGKGIPPELLSKVTERGGTFGKEGGNGLGLSHAKSTVESWFGQFSIESTLGVGTTVTIELPQVETPSWFADQIVITPKTPILILDDDPGIHMLWEDRFKALNAPNNYAPKLTHFKSSEEILTWYRTNLNWIERCLYLCDYELVGSTQSGLDIIEMLGIEREAILVTNRADEPELRERCIKKSVRILPKLLASEIPIKVETVG